MPLISLQPASHLPRHQRFDAGLLRPSHQTDEGFLVCEAFVARPGVYEYVQPDGSIVRELILPEELHRADSLGTLALKPITLEHPPEDVTPDNWTRYAAGDVGSEVTVVEGGYVKVVMTTKRRDALGALERGVRETSPGYTCRIEETSGEHPDYGPYDQIQRDRRYNHLAITERARGGPTIHARVDGAIITAPVRGAYQRRTDTLFAHLPGTRSATSTKRDTMTPEEIQRLAAAAAQAALEQQAKRQDGEDKYDALNKKVDKLASTLDAFMKSKKDKGSEEGEEEDSDEGSPAPKKKADSVDFKTYYTQRRKLEELGQRHRIDSKQIAELDNPALAKAIVLAAKPDARQDGDERYYMDAVDFLTEQPSRQDGEGRAPGLVDPWEQTSKAFEQQRHDGGGNQPPPSQAMSWTEQMSKQFANRHR